eukprot:COSAG04_NODE_16320_length_503_cov_0.757426_1_plen_112_part_01
MMGVRPAGGAVKVPAPMGSPDLPSLPSEMVLRVAASLDARDLSHLARVCRRFSLPHEGGVPGAAAGGQAGGGEEQESPEDGQKKERWSVVEEAARRWLQACGDFERELTPRR